jgi:hypothetical protein
LGTSGRDQAGGEAGGEQKAQQSQRTAHEIGLDPTIV